MTLTYDDAQIKEDELNYLRQCACVALDAYWHKANIGEFSLKFRRNMLSIMLDLATESETEGRAA